eukprot:3186871-Pleurochrysis_carterae.AAC.1
MSALVLGVSLLASTQEREFGMRLLDARLVCVLTLLPRLVVQSRRLGLFCAIVLFLLRRVGAQGTISALAARGRLQRR